MQVNLWKHADPACSFRLLPLDDDAPAVSFAVTLAFDAELSAKMMHKLTLDVIKVGWEFELGIVRFPKVEQRFFDLDSEVLSNSVLAGSLRARSRISGSPAVSSA